MSILRGSGRRVAFNVNNEAGGPLKDQQPSQSASHDWLGGDGGRR